MARSFTQHPQQTIETKRFGNTYTDPIDVDELAQIEATHKAMRVFALAKSAASLALDRRAEPYHLVRKPTDRLLPRWIDGWVIGTFSKERSSAVAEDTLSTERGHHRLFPSADRDDTILTADGDLVACRFSYAALSKDAAPSYPLSRRGVGYSALRSLQIVPLTTENITSDVGAVARSLDSAVEGDQLIAVDGQLHTVSYDDHPGFTEYPGGSWNADTTDARLTTFIRRLDWVLPLEPDTLIEELNDRR